jgi:SNF2 family DNA or RNA helicase
MSEKWDRYFLRSDTLDAMPFDSATLTPMPHQLTGADFLARRGFALLADEPGLGKTATAILGADKCGARKVLVVCPAVVRQHWAREFERWASKASACSTETTTGERSEPADEGQGRTWQKTEREVTVCEGFLDFVPGPGVTIVSHATLADEDVPGRKQKPGVGKSMKNLRLGAPYDLIVIDEVHSFRAYDAIRTTSLLAPDMLWSWATRVWCLSGTPMVNSPADLWPLAYGPMRMQVSWWDWGNRFADPISNGTGGFRFSGLKNAEELASVLRPHVLRRTLEGLGIKLPGLTIADARIDLPAGVMQRVMADLEGWTAARLLQALEEKDELHDSALARVRKALGLAKVADAVAAADGILRGGDGPVVVFFQHTSVREELFAELRGRLGWKTSWIDGKVSKAQLAAAEGWFQSGRLDCLLVQTDAGGVGISLTRANRVVVAELPWTAVGLWQAVKRCHRITQTRAVLAEVLRAKGCWLEDALGAAIAKKHRASEHLLSLLETRA